MGTCNAISFNFDSIVSQYQFGLFHLHQNNLEISILYLFIHLSCTIFCDYFFFCTVPIAYTLSFFLFLLHKVVELWTKRKFCCDCGNSKFGGPLCKLCPDKDSENPKNSYNHNFKGSYCTCGRPYPDPEAKEQIEMIQCCICEDWFHEDHIGPNSIGKVCLFYMVLINNFILDKFF
jgi:hypothetical protein